MRTRVALTEAGPGPAVAARITSAMEKAGLLSPKEVRASSPTWPVSVRTAAALLCATTVAIAGWLLVRDSWTVQNSFELTSKGEGDSSLPVNELLGGFHTDGVNQIVLWRSAESKDAVSAKTNRQSWDPLHRGEWAAGDEFRVPEGVNLTLELVPPEDEAESGLRAAFRLTGPAELNIESSSTCADFSAFLETGRLAAVVESRVSDAPFVVDTPQAKIRVVGTQFVLTVADQRTSLRVDEGAVAFLTPDGLTQVLVTSESAERVISAAGLLPLAADSVVAEGVGPTSEASPTSAAPDEPPATSALPVKPKDAAGPSLKESRGAEALDQPVQPRVK